MRNSYCSAGIAVVILTVGCSSMPHKARPTSPEAFPAVGHVYHADLGEIALDLDFSSAGQMTFTGTQGSVKGDQQTVSYTVTPLRPGLFAVTWAEKQGKIVQIEDFEQGTLHSFVTLSSGHTAHLSGRLTRVR
ncbi:MAG TPA: hypothetical protein VHL58_12820 [Thermoanaerobaculia bacterium]|nr:hypothetical protein [Thermoanaerobaculia bacterium]